MVKPEFTGRTWACVMRRLYLGRKQGKTENGLFISIVLGKELGFEIPNTIGNDCLEGTNT